MPNNINYNDLFTSITSQENGGKAISLAGPKNDADLNIDGFIDKVSLKNKQQSSDKDKM